MRGARLFLAFFLAAFVLVVVRVLTDAIVLEPHYFWPIKKGLLKAPLLVGFLPLTALADLGAALAIAVGVRTEYAGRHGAALGGMVLCLFAAHLGQGNPLKLPLTIPIVWAVSSAAACWGAAFLADAIRPEPAFEPEEAEPA